MLSCRGSHVAAERRRVRDGVYCKNTPYISFLHRHHVTFSQSAEPPLGIWQVHCHKTEPRQNDTGLGDSRLLGQARVTSHRNAHVLSSILRKTLRNSIEASQQQSTKFKQYQWTNKGFDDKDFQFGVSVGNYFKEEDFNFKDFN